MRIIDWFRLGGSKSVTRPAEAQKVLGELDKSKELADQLDELLERSEKRAVRRKARYGQSS